MINRKYAVPKVERTRMFVSMNYLILLIILCSCEAPMKSLDFDFGRLDHRIEDLNISDQKVDQTVVLELDEIELEAVPAIGQSDAASVEIISVDNKALRIIDHAIEELTIAQTTTGAVHSHLESTIDNMEQAKVNVASAKSRMIEADLAVESTAPS